MDGNKLSISPHDLYASLGSDAAPIIVDVRRDSDFINSGRLLGPAFHRSPDHIEQWQDALPAGRPVVTYCCHGDQVSQGVAFALRTMGVDANFLERSIDAWTERGLPTHRNIGATPSKWGTREHPKIDRIACPWLILRFIDPNAEFIYVPRDQVLTVAEQTGATPYDIDGVEFTHEGDRCSFDAIMRVYDIKDAPWIAGHYRARGRHSTARPCSSMRGSSRDLPWIISKFSRRSRDARAWSRHLRRALSASDP